MKKLLAMLMALMMAVCVFSACSKEEKKVDNNAVDVKTEAKKDVEEKKTEEKSSDASDVVEDFMKALASFDVDEDDYDKFFAKDADYEDEYNEVVELYAKIPESLTKEFDGMEELFGDEFTGSLIDSTTKKLKGIIEYEIKDVEEDGDTAKVKAVLIAPDFEGVDMEDEELLEKASEKAFGFNLNDEEALMNAWMEKEGVKSQAELLEKFANASEEDVMKSVSELLSGGMEDFIGELLDAVIENAKKEEVEINFEIEKIDGEWKIVEMN